MSECCCHLSNDWLTPIVVPVQYPAIVIPVAIPDPIAESASLISSQTLSMIPLNVAISFAMSDSLIPGKKLPYAFVKFTATSMISTSGIVRIRLALHRRIQ